ncbi:MAG: diphthamide synthesis protein, partial [Candidatus Bathyarchaeia archaeon]
SLGEELKRKFIEKGKSVTLLSLREVTPEALNNFPNIEAFVNISCPRIGMDDSERFPKPILNPQEAMVAFGSAVDRFHPL